MTSLNRASLKSHVEPRSHLLTLFLTLGIALSTQSAHAEVYKCTKNGSITYSESPCDGAIETIKVDPHERTGMSLSNDSIEGVSKDLASDRSVRDLERAITTQERRVEKIEERYQKELRALEDKLARLKTVRMTQDDWKRYKQTKNKIADRKRKYKADRRRAREKLWDLKRDLNRARR